MLIHMQCTITPKFPVDDHTKLSKISLWRVKYTVPLGIKSQCQINVVLLSFI